MMRRGNLKNLVAPKAPIFLVTAALLLSSSSFAFADASSSSPTVNAMTPDDASARAAHGLKLIIAAAASDGPMPFAMECSGPPCQNEKYVRRELSHLSESKISGISESKSLVPDGPIDYIDKFRVDQSDGYWEFEIDWGDTSIDHEPSEYIKHLKIHFTWTVVP